MMTNYAKYSSKTPSCRIPLPFRCHQLKIPLPTDSTNRIQEADLQEFFDAQRALLGARRGLSLPSGQCPETGKVTILRFVAAHDVGDAIRLSYVEGQIQGVAQGIGWALNEEYIYDKNGRLDNAGFLNYLVPVASDMPMIEPILVEVPNPAHPYGAKGAGEVNIVPPMAAIANAIDSAIHRRLTELPMSPPKARAALDHTGADD
jgi:hypothetical protein